ncbi:MAG: DUF362 domain-containing protein [Bacteroidales bacterium]|nr:DUF362 domain-containing protein [Bacteroidales bacterium]
MTSKVYFTNLRTDPKHSLVKKMESVAVAAGFNTINFQDKFTAIKIHFGEAGNLAFLRPNYAARIAEMVRGLGGKPFLTDSNTLYSGSRSNAVDHLQCAAENGYNLLSAKCNVIIADGLKGTEYREIPVGGEYCPSPKIGAAIADADIVISMTHFKGHEQTGFGGTLKNLGMGSASVAGKLELHSSSKPVINTDNCRGCNMCVRSCAHNALLLNDKHKAVIDYDHCVGCGQCVAVCQYDGAVLKDWDTTQVLNCKIAEYSKAVVKGKPSFHISFIMDVSPECDCWCHNDAAIVPNIGILASFDPVALDQACADLVMQAPKIVYHNKLEEIHYHDNSVNDDIFHVVHPDTDWKFGLEHGEKIGLGSRKYELITIV